MNEQQKSNANTIAQGTIIILVSFWFAMILFSCSAPSHGYNYGAHAKHNSALKHKAETGRLPKCGRH